MHDRLSHMKDVGVWGLTQLGLFFIKLKGSFSTLPTNVRKAVTGDDMQKIFFEYLMFEYIAAMVVMLHLLCTLRKCFNP